MVCWMAGDKPLTPRSRLIVKHTSRTVKAIVTDLHYRIDVNTLHRDESASQLGLNEVGRVSLRLTQPVFTDPYSRNRLTGGMILIDEATNATAGAAMITDTGECRRGGGGDAFPRSGTLRGDPAGHHAAAIARRQLAGGGGPDPRAGPEDVRDQHLAYPGRAGQRQRPRAADPVAGRRNQPAVPARRVAPVHFQATWPARQ